jgi:hypothetical protein
LAVLTAMRTAGFWLQTSVLEWLYCRKIGSIDAYKEAKTDKARRDALENATSLVRALENPADVPRSLAVLTAMRTAGFWLQTSVLEWLYCRKIGSYRSE